MRRGQRRISSHNTTVSVYDGEPVVHFADPPIYDTEGFCEERFVRPNHEYKSVDDDTYLSLLSNLSFTQRKHEINFGVAKVSRAGWHYTSDGTRVFLENQGHVSLFRNSHSETTRRANQTRVKLA